MNNFRELNVWQKAMNLVTQIYKSTKYFPKEEQFGLTNQIRRCAVSIPSNIAEGAGRDSSKDFNRFLSIALGSSFELETQLIISKELEYISIESSNSIENELIEIQKMIRGLQKSLNK
ncbi:MAG: four helix bundle protein [Bacteroidetes bacterium]|nr:four helix bundle protein [Bacteroidota bacterium]